MRSMKSFGVALFCLFALSLEVTAQTTPLVSHGDVWRWHKGNGGLPVAGWKTNADATLGATWFSSAGGFGFSNNNANETNNCKTILSDMRNGYSTVFYRREFTISSPVDPTQHLLLTVDFDDGFIAWLDGVYLTNANVTGAPAQPATNALASASHESSLGN